MTIRYLFVAAAATALCAFTSHAEFANYQSADLVLGQADFTSSWQATTQTGLSFPCDVAVDPATGKVFVADKFNNRVLRYASSASLTNGAPAEAVFGQSDFISNGTAAAQNKIFSPSGVCISSTGHLWVADQGNNRVLWFEDAVTKASGALADGVLGQAVFTTNGMAAGMAGMNNPAGLVVDFLGNLWVVDQGNHRVLCFTNVASKVNGANADIVLGQPDFATVTSGLSDMKMNNPARLAISAAGALWVTDSFNNRILRFDNVITKANGAAADGVLGQSDFATDISDTSAAKFFVPDGVAIDASGTLYASDDGNHRVVFFKNAAAKANGADADGVLGQSDFVTSNGNLTINGMTHVQGIALDPAGRLYVTQIDSSRITRYSPFNAPVPIIDGTPKINVIGKKKFTTSKSVYTLRGSTSSAIGLMKVQYRVGKGAFKAAQGTTSWRVKVRKLKLGTNKVTILATANDGKVASQIIRIKRTL